jgi:uncharacterized protein
VILYLDTTSLLRHYVREEASVAVDSWITHADFCSTSCASLTEAASILARRPPWERPSRVARARALDSLRDDWDDYIVVALDERRAAEIAWRRHLRGLDAVHLAAAATLADLAAPIAVVFSSFDRELARAAREEGLGVIQPPS